MKPYYQRNGITIYCGDCLEVMPGLDNIESIVSDPPYGMNNDTNYTRFSGGSRGHRKRGMGRNYQAPIAGDDKPFNPTPFLGYQNVLLFGYNHFASRLFTGSLLVWIKRNDEAFGSFLSDAEIAWLNKGHGIYCYKDLSMNAIANDRTHPNEKPVSLMAWCIGRIKNPGLICDPFMGSGTTLVAAQNEGRRAIGIEISEDYCKIAVERLRQPSFFSIPDEPKPQAKQAGF